MNTTLDAEFEAMMRASHGEDWLESLHPSQVHETRLAFFGGAVSVLKQIPVDPRVNAPRDPLQSLRTECARFLRAVKSAAR